MLVVGASTSKKLQIITSAIASIRVHGSYISTDTSTPPVPQNIDDFFIPAITTITTTDILVGAASTKKRLGVMHVRNEDTAVTCDVTLQLTDGTNVEPLIKVSLLPLETLEFDGYRWWYYDKYGIVYAQSSKLDAKKFVVSDIAFATAASFADVTGLSAPLISGRKYAFEAHLYHISNATTTGAQFGVNIGAAPTVLQIATIDTVTGSVTASVHSAGATTSRDTAATAQTTGSAAVTMAILSGFIQPSADGTFAIRCTSEVTVAAGVTVKAGSWLRIWECD